MSNELKIIKTRKPDAVSNDNLQDGLDELAVGDEEFVIRYKNLSIDTENRTVNMGGEEIDLTKTEFDLLKYLVTNKGTILSRDQIMKQVWGYDYIGVTNVIDVYIRYLRAKLDEKFDTKFIHTIRGIGYILE